MIELLPEQEEQRKKIEELKRKEKEEELRKQEEELRKQREEEEKKKKEEEEKIKKEEEEMKKENNENEQSDNNKEKSSKNKNSNDENKSKILSNKEKEISETNKSKKISNKEEKKTETNKSKKLSNKEDEKSETNKKENENEEKENEENENKENEEYKDKEEEDKKENEDEEKKSNNNDGEENKDKIENENEENKEKDNQNKDDKENKEDNNNESLPEENLSELEKESEENKNDTEENEEEEEKTNNNEEKKTENEEIIEVKKKKKKKDEFFKEISKKNYKFKYMRAFYEETPDYFEREYAIINFNDLFITNDFFYLYADIEINDMIYKRALREDRRSFCQMYWSFIKYKNNYIFSFYKDYFNFIPVKISILVYSLSLFPFITCLFISDSLLHEMYIKSYENQNHVILMNNSTSIVQYIISPIIIDILFYLFKKFVLFENDVIDLIHKKKYHSNYVLQEMVKGYDVRDEKDEYEKQKILYSIQNQNKKKEKSDENNDMYYGGGEVYEGDSENNNYEKDFEENRTLINEIRFETSNLMSRINTRQSLFYLAAIIFSLFHFYYVYVFTTVYYNCTQKIIYSSSISLVISFIYPFLNCLVFVSLRYFGLNRGFKNYYKLSKVFAFL